MKLLLISIIVLLLYVSNSYVDKYYWFLPSERHDPREVRLVENAVRGRTPEDVRFHALTDRSVSPAFLWVLESRGKHGHTLSELDQLILPHVSTILGHKLRHNRSRPWQVEPSLDRLPSVSANNPSYPSGHAYQAWVLCVRLSELYPELAPELAATAQRCADIRVIAGLHFPSDGECSKQLVLKKYLKLSQ